MKLTKSQNKKLNARMYSLSQSIHSEFGVCSVDRVGDDIRLTVRITSSRSLEQRFSLDVNDAVIIAAGKEMISHRKITPSPSRGLSFYNRQNLIKERVQGTYC